MTSLPGRGASRESPAGVPDGLPVPGRFAHLHPDDGACLMEAAALLSCGRFTDSPAGTHPALAALARVVNDSVGDDARYALWPLAADLADTHPAGRDYAPWTPHAWCVPRHGGWRGTAVRAVGGRRDSPTRPRLVRQPGSPIRCGGAGRGAVTSSRRSACCVPHRTPISGCRSCCGRPWPRRGSARAAGLRAGSFAATDERTGSSYRAP